MKDIIVMELDAFIELLKDIMELPKDISETDLALLLKSILDDDLK